MYCDMKGGGKCLATLASTFFHVMNVTLKFS